VDVRCTKNAGVFGIRARFDGRESIGALSIGREQGVAFEIGVERRGIAIAGMRVAAVRVGLPDLDARARDRPAAPVDDSTGELDDLPAGARIPPLDASQVGVMIGRLGDGVERTENLCGCAAYLLLRREVGARRVGERPETTDPNQFATRDVTHGFSGMSGPLYP
jgi:hypothetical protein